MGRGCIVNVNNRGIPLIEYLKSMGKIQGYTQEKDYKICFEFKGELEITFQDYLQILPNVSVIRVSRGREKIERESFNKWILLEIVKTIQGGEVLEYIPGEKIRLRDTEKTEIVCVRLSQEEKERLERESRELGVTVSELVRSKIFQ
ncbi:MAG: hypothetical protein QXQ84_09155 [Nitrososphaerota archaeon]